MTTPAGDPNAVLSGVPMPLLPGVKGRARFSVDGRHRYELWRIRNEGAPYALFIGLNPSIGAPDVDDPTLRRMQGFATREGYENVCVANAFSIRGTDPDILRRVTDPTNEENDRTIAALHAGSAVTICAWGNDARQYARDHNLRQLLKERDTYCLGTTRSGYPRHPLYVHSEAALVPYPPTRSVV